MQSAHQERTAQKTWRSPHTCVRHWLSVPRIFLRAPLSSDAVAFSLSRGASHRRDGKLATSCDTELYSIRIRTQRSSQLGFLHRPYRRFPHSPRFSGKGYRHSSKASRREDLEVEEPVPCGDSPSFDFHPTLAGMLGAALIRNQVVQVRQPAQKRLLAPLGMMEAFHHEQLPLDGVVGLIQQGARHGHLRVFKDGIPAGLLVLKPASHPLAIGRPAVVAT